jgi:L,D-transpeptidase YcbB
VGRGAVCFLLAGALLSGRGARLYGQTSSEPKFACDQLTDSGASSSPLALRRTLCELADGGRLDELRWSSFTQFRNQLLQFYRATEFAPVWLHEGQPSPRALALIELMQHANEKGLRADDYDAPRWAGRLDQLKAQPADANLARFDLALTVSAMRYVTDLHRGRVNPNEVEFALPFKTFSGGEFLRKHVLNAADVQQAVRLAEPTYFGYARTIAALKTYLELAKKGDGDPLPPVVKTVLPGGKYAGVPQLARRLQLLGDLAKDASLPAEPDLYEGALVTAVRHFQQRHGLPANGHLGEETLRQLSIPISRRLQQFELTMERWRWLPDNAKSSLLAVNIPEFRLRAFEDHKEVLSMKVIVGQSFDHQTPAFADDMEYVIFRPYWNVPTSIIKNEIVPALRRNPRYLRTHHMEAVNSHGEVVSRDAAGSAIVRQLKAGNLELRQQPGPWNALGLLKFILPNQYSVYLHGTPDRNLFQRPRRDFSHGCIRVEDPPALAAWVLRENPGWTPAKIQAAMRGTQSLQVNLKHTLPVLVLYGTAFVEEDGTVNFFDDIYSLDVALEKALDRVHP